MWKNIFTAWVAKMIQKKLINEGHSVELSSIENKPAIKNKDLIIIGGPIYAGNMPEMVIRWVLKNVPNTDNSRAMVFTTSASLKNAYGVKSIGMKLQKKGYDIKGLLTYKLPRNYYMEGYEKTTLELSAKLFNEAKRKIKDDLLDMNRNIILDEKVLGKDLMAEFMSLATRFMGKNFSTNSSCTLCNKCVRNCPTSNISIKGKVKFGYKCMMCTRCIHSCPVNAIQYKSKSFEQYKIKDTNS